MSKVSLVDNGFLLTESPHSPKHVAGLQIMRLPPRKGSAWLRKLVADLKNEPPGHPFDKKLHYRIPLYPDLVEDPDIDMDYHVRHTVLPSPGDDEQLWKTVSRLHANLLDRDRPLWEFHLIDGIRGGRFALYLKLHHAYADGMTMTSWMDRGLARDEAIVTEGKVEFLDARPAEVRRQKYTYLLGRPGTMRECAYAALFLACDESSFVTGHALLVDGGLTAQLQDAAAKYVEEQVLAELGTSGQ